MGAAPPSRADRLPDEHDARATGLPLAVNDQDLLELRVDSHPRPHLCVLIWEGHIGNTPERGLEVGDDLLAPDDQDDAARPGRTDPAGSRSRMRLRGPPPP